MASIAVDVMSGDSGAPELIPGALHAVTHDPDLELILVGQPSVIEPALAQAPAAVRARLSIQPAASIVGMSEHPREAIRKRKDSSMRIAIDLVKEGRAGAMVSAGNTGALTAMAHFVLKTVGPVERAPIMSAVPARNGGHTHMLDLGANTKASAIQLAQFATMGSIVARDVFGIEKPRVGLLNIGEEETKGHEVVQDAHELIRALPGIRRRQQYLRRQRRRRGHGRLHGQCRAEGNGRPGQAHRRAATHGVHS
jgi:phosphate acyltransferase